ncbi:MAG: hypothetical protein GQE15_32035 [Archangiaceae bacterium]|nr:hypothetical protein [Archangiaceae bacterium]
MALKPLSIGEIVDRSTSLWRSNWKALFQLLLGFQLVQYISLKGIELLIDRTLPAAKNPAQAFELMKADPSTWLPQVWPIAISVMVVGLVNFFVSQVAGVAISAFVFPRVTSAGAPSIGEAMQLAVRKLGPTFGVLVLTLGWTMLAGLLFMLPGILTVGGGVYLAVSNSQQAGTGVALLGTFLILGGGLVLILWFLIRFVLTSQVLAVEDVSALGCFRRTDALSSGRVGPGFAGLVKGRLTLLISIIAFILTVVGLVTGLPELGIKAMFGELTGAASGTAPQALVVPAQLLQVVTGAVVTPLYMVFQVVFYVDMRVRREGLDLELAAKPVTA